MNYIQAGANRMLYIPPWLEKKMGYRERAITEASDVKCMQCLPEWAEDEENRLPAGMQYIVSESLQAWFVIDGKTQSIVG